MIDLGEVLCVLRTEFQVVQWNLSYWLCLVAPYLFLFTSVFCFLFIGIFTVSFSAEWFITAIHLLGIFLVLKSVLLCTVFHSGAEHLPSYRFHLPSITLSFFIFLEFRNHSVFCCILGIWCIVRSCFLKPVGNWK